MGLRGSSRGWKTPRGCGPSRCLLDSKRKREMGALVLAFGALLALAIPVLLDATYLHSGVSSKRFLGPAAVLHSRPKMFNMPSTESNNEDFIMLPAGEEAVRLASLAKGFSALQSLSEAAATAAATPWKLSNYDIPLHHRSGVKVDLGKSVKIDGTWYRIPNGGCPVWGKSIKTHQPTTNSKTWPNNYLEEIPVKSSRPFGGGYVVSSDLFSERDTMKWQAKYQGLLKKYPDMDKKVKKQIEDSKFPIDWCVFASFEQNLPKLNGVTYMEYRYPVALDAKNNKCYPLYVSIQELKPGVCSMGDKKPAMSWYCVDPVKDPKKPDMVYASAYVKPDWVTKCPMYPIRNSQFGQWSGSVCMPLAPVDSKKVSSADECGILVFNRSPSDYTKKPYEPGSWSDPLTALSAPLDGLIDSDSPHSSGIGINYATYYPDGTCYLHTATPNCMLPLINGFAFTSVGTHQSAKAIGPPCPAGETGYSGFCNCKTKKRLVSGCIKDQWVNKTVDCKCSVEDPGYEDNEEAEEPKKGSGINPWLIAGPFIGVAVLALCGGAGYYFARRRRRDPKSSMAEASGTLETTAQGGKKKRDVSDLMQEADPSFWGEGRRESDATQVMIETTY